MLTVTCLPSTAPGTTPLLLTEVALKAIRCLTGIAQKQVMQVLLLVNSIARPDRPNDMAEFAGVPARFGFEQVIGPNQGREVQSEGSLLENSTGSSSQLTTGRRLPFTKGGKTKRDPPFPDVHPGQNYGQTPLPGARIKDIDWRQTSAARRAYLGVGAQVANHHAAVLPWLRATRRPIERRDTTQIDAKANTDPKTKSTAIWNTSHACFASVTRGMIYLTEVGKWFARNTSMSKSPCFGKILQSSSHIPWLLLGV